MQTTPDDGLWKSESTRNNFSKIIYQNTCQKTWKDPNKII